MVGRAVGRADTLRRNDKRPNLRVPISICGNRFSLYLYNRQELTDRETMRGRMSINSAVACWAGMTVLAVTSFGGNPPEVDTSSTDVRMRPNYPNPF